MGDVLPGQMVGYFPTAVPLRSLAPGRFLGRRGVGRFIGERWRRVGIEEVKLPGRFRQPLAARPEKQTLQYEVFFLEARVGTPQLLGRRAGLVELTFQVVE